MFTKCPHCNHRYSVPTRAVLDEARRLAEKAKNEAWPADCRTGDTLTPEDEAAALARATASQDAAVGKVMGRRR